MAEKKTVLVAEDNAVNRAVLQRILEIDYQVLLAEDGEKALQILEKEHTRIAAIILDLVMPVMDGYTFLQVMQKTPEYLKIPVIISTALGNVEDEKKTLRLGAWDFVSKPYDVDILRFRLKNAIDRSQLSAFHQLKYLAEHDTLTGLYNKSRFLTATHELLKTGRAKQYVFVRFDIDHFQLINAFYGTSMGDELLRYIADHLKKMLDGQEEWTLGRIEADVFAFCIPCENEDSIAGLAEDCKEWLRRFNLDYSIVPTMGVYRIEDRGEDVNSMLDKANLATKKIKGNFINNYMFYTEKLSEKLEKEQRITNEMMTALEEEQFEIYLQPKYNLRTNSIAGAEALVRWRHPLRGMVAPGDFIPVFERNGFIIKLDFYVWEKVCQLLRQWLDKGLSPYPVSVNVSRVNIYNPKFIESICALTNKYKIPKELLELELTESAYTDNPEAMKETMKILQKEGFLILMDDFGSAYSSLNVLKDIEMDILKIDMKFMLDAETPGRSQNILASIVRMAKWLYLPVIAEGVEKREQVDFLRGIGCEYVQGYYFAKPMPVTQYEDLVKAGVSAETEKRRRMESFGELWDPNSEMEQLFSNMTQPVVLYEYTEDWEQLEGIRVNQAFSDLFGYEDPILRGAALESFVELVDVQTVRNAFHEVVENRRIAQCEYRRCNSDGKQIWIHADLKYIIEVADKHLIFGTLTDITEQKAVEAELQKYQKNFLLGRRTGRMLIVDDVEVNREILKEMFQDRFQVLEAVNGKQALEVLEQQGNRVDIILLDLEMPVMNGKEFLEVKRQNSVFDGIPVVIITGDQSEEQQVKLLSEGISDYILKPFVRESVIRRIANVLESNIHYQNMSAHAMAALRRLKEKGR